MERTDLAAQMGAVIRGAAGVSDGVAADIEAELITLGAMPGLSRLAGQFRRQLEVRRKAAARGMREAAPDDDVVYGSLSDALAECGAEVPDGLPIPEGYRIVGAMPAIHRQRQTREGMAWMEVAPRLIALTGSARDDETGAIRVTVGWLYGRRWVERTVPRSILSDRTKLGALADDGAPVDATALPEVQRWLLAQEVACDPALPHRRALRRMGWTPDLDAFLLGAEGVGAKMALMAPGEGEEGHAAGYHQGGTLDGWRQHVWQPVSQIPAGVVVLASLSAPLLSVLGLPGWTLDVGSETSQGKTTAQLLAASAWGDPDVVLTPWPRTWAATRTAMEFRHSVPCILDDTKHAAGKPGLVQEAVYAASQRASQSLGSAGGGTRAQRAVRTVLISSGEAPIVSFCHDSRGATTRMVTLRDSPFPAGSHALVSSVAEAARDHYGHAGLAVVRWLVAHRGDWPELQRLHRVVLDRLVGGDRVATGARVLSYVAHLAVTARVLRDALGIDVPKVLLDMARQWVDDSSVDRDAPLAALLYAGEWWDARQARVRPGSNPSGSASEIGWVLDPYDLHGGGTFPRYGWRTDAIRECLKSAGYVPNEILAAWRARGWLHTTEIGKFTTKTRLPTGDRETRLVVLTLEGMRAMLG